MRKSLRIFALVLLIVLSLPSNLTAQNYDDNLRALKEELLLSKQLLAIYDEQMIALAQALPEARASAENSAQKITDLETSLSEAVKQRDVQALQVQSLELQLTALSKSLVDSKVLAEANEARAAVGINNLAKGYELQLRTRSIIIYIGIGVVVVETGLLLWQLLK